MERLYYKCKYDKLTTGYMIPVKRDQNGYYITEKQLYRALYKSLVIGDAIIFDTDEPVYVVDNYGKVIR